MAKRAAKKAVKRPGAGAPKMSSTLARIRKVNCPECKGDGCFSCQQSGDIRDAFKTLKAELEETDDNLFQTQRELAEKVDENKGLRVDLKDLSHQVESLFGALTEIEGEPITPDELRFIKNTRMMTRSGPTIEGEENTPDSPMQRAIKKSVYKGPGLGTIIFNYIEELEVEKCDHGPDGRCQECYERRRAKRALEKPPPKRLSKKAKIQAKKRAGHARRARRT